MLDIRTYKAEAAGPVFTVLGAVHGDETCGTEAIRRIIHKLDSGTLTLTKGTLVMVPITNPKAYEKNVRFFERNLNRCLHHAYQGTGAYEDQINPILCPLLANTDVLLDLHSYSSPGGPFIFLSGKKENTSEIAFATALGVYDFVHGWQEAFGNSNAELDPLYSTGTTEYTREMGGMGITLECGQHLNKDGPDVGENAILRALKHLGMIEVTLPPEQKKPLRCVRMKLAFTKLREGTFARTLTHYDAVKKGEVLARYADGETIAAPEDGFVVLPKAAAEIGQDWFFFGIASDLLK
jgi:predicted deacylase